MKSLLRVGVTVTPCSPTVSGRLEAAHRLSHPTQCRFALAEDRRQVPRRRLCKVADQELVAELAVRDVDENYASPSETPTEPELEDANVEAEAADDISESQGYATISLEGCEFLVAQHSDGGLDLQDVYVWDEDAGVYARPVSTGEIPEGPAHYVQVPWREEFLGDQSNGKMPFVQDLKMFLINDGSAEDGNGMLDLEKVFVLDAATRSVAREVVQRKTASEDPLQCVLRIRAGKLTLENTDSIPIPESVVAAAEAGTVAHSREKDDFEAPVEEVDSLNDDFDSPDIPAVDFA